MNRVAAATKEGFCEGAGPGGTTPKVKVWGILAAVAIVNGVNRS